LGLKKLQREAEARTPEGDSETRFEREAGSSSDPERGPDAHRDPAEADPSLTSVVAQPEFIRPQPGGEVEKEKETIRPVPQPVRKEAADEIVTLPSWRGQYRKKRYPPA
jgi:hypothetical protein